MTRFEKWMLWSSTALVAVTGGIYAWMKYLLTTADPYAVVNHPWQPLVLKLHILTAPLLVFAVGIVFTRHIWKQWRLGLRRGRQSGLGTLLTFVPMVMSGYLIQTLTHDGWLWWMVAIHLVGGGLYTVAFLGHQVMIAAGESRRRREAERRLAAQKVEATAADPAAAARGLRRR